MSSDFVSRRSHCLIFDLAVLLLTIFSQSMDGPLAFSDVMISMMSPFWRGWSIGTIFPLTLAPMHFAPTAEWILKAKSRGMDPFGSSMTSPAGVNTNTWLENRSTLRDSMNSLGSFVSCCLSSA